MLTLFCLLAYGKLPHHVWEPEVAAGLYVLAITVQLGLALALHDK